MDFHPIRQYIGASVTKAHYAQMGGITDPVLKEAAVVTLERQELFEPQILPFLSAVVWRIAGQELLWVQRLMSILLWISGGVALIQICKRWLSEVEQLLMLFVYLFIPFSILCSRVIQPDPAMVVTMLWSMERLYAWRDNPSRGRFVAFLFLAGLSVILKPMSIFMIWAVYVGPQFYKERLKGVFSDKRMWLLTAVMILPNVLWYLKGHMSGDTMSEQSDMSFLPRIFLDASYYAGFFKMVGRNIGFLPAMILLWETFKGTREGLRQFLQFYMFAYLCYALIFHYHASTHDYYSIMLIPVAAIAVVSWCMDVAVPKWSSKQLVTQKTVGWLVGAGAVGLGLSVFVMTKGFSSRPSSVKSIGEALALNIGVCQKQHTWIMQKPERNAEIIRQHEEIGEVVGHSTRVLHLTDDHGKSLIYHGALEGFYWPTRERFELLSFRGSGPSNEIVYLNTFIHARSAQYMVVTKMDELTKSVELFAYLDATFPVMRSTDDYMIYSFEEK